MPVRNSNWYDTNEQQPYPISELASGLSDTGVSMRDDLIADLHLRFPKVAGSYAYIGGITITRQLVSIVIVAADAPQSTSGFVPLAAITVQQPATAGQHYAVTPLYPGVGGWIAFGGGISEDFVGRYSSPQQTLLLSRCARAYRELPVASLGKVGKAVALTGIVTIRGGTDVAVLKETRSISAVVRDVLVVRLRQDATGRNVLADYVSECQARPESRNCAQPGIETINGVSPDCDGNINLVFEGNSLYTAPFVDCGPGITIDSRLSLAELCAASRSPERIPDDLCSSELLSSESLEPDPEESESEVPEESESLGNCAETPHTQNFASAVPADWTKISGEFEHSEEDPPSGSDGSTAAISGSERNVLLYDSCEDNNIGHSATVDLRILPTYPSRNGGLVMNYHTINPLSNPKLEYFMVLLDQSLGRLQVQRFSRNGTIIEYTSPPLQIFINRWYRIYCGVTQVGPSIVLDISVYDLDGPSPGTPILTTSLPTNNWLPANGRHGITSFLSHTEFGRFTYAI